jgi:hypothetical protein
MREVTYRGIRWRNNAGTAERYDTNLNEWVAYTGMGPRPPSAVMDGIEDAKGEDLLRMIARDVRTIRTIMVAWVVLTVIGVVLVIGQLS